MKSVKGGIHPGIPDAGIHLIFQERPIQLAASRTTRLNACTVTAGGDRMRVLNRDLNTPIAMITAGFPQQGHLKAGLAVGF